MVARRLSDVEAVPQIPAFYAGKHLFITGGTGFMGKVLLERLLSTCPDIGRIHLLMRAKKDEDPLKRLAQLKQCEVFSNLRRSNPSQLEKLRVVAGDTSLPGLGLAEDGRRQIQEVSILFHSAATLKFDEELKKAVDQNVRSVIRLLDIADTLPTVDAFVHVSTAYCMAELTDVREEVYAPPMSRDELEAIVDHVDEGIRAELTQRLLGSKPNTYTFTKAMAESAINERRPRYPVAIFRPTIVISSWRHPFPGWIENLNGPAGVAVGAGKGLLHTFRCKDDARADLLPVDIAIDTMIASAWDVHFHRSPAPRVYNCSTIENPTTWGEFATALAKYVKLEPLDGAYWYPYGTGTYNKYQYQLKELLMQTVPLYVADFVFNLLGIKTKISLRKVCTKLKAMNAVLTFFSCREWQFRTEHVRDMRSRLSATDRGTYNLDPATIVWEEQYKNFVIGVRRYLLKEKDQDMEKARTHMRRMYYLHSAVKLGALSLLVRLALSRSAVARGLVYGALRALGRAGAALSDTVLGTSYTS